jgi:transcriptional regulator with XRE-family HTH domain
MIDEESKPGRTSAVLEVARGVAYWRESRELTVEQLAQQSGIPSVVLEAVEAGQHDPDIDLLDRLVFILEIRLIDLFAVDTSDS